MNIFVICGYDVNDCLSYVESIFELRRGWVSTRRGEHTVNNEIERRWMYYINHQLSDSARESERYSEGQ
jgi:hypothetical protein